MRRFFAEIIFWLHIVIILVWLILFAIPTSLWPDRITFHFYYSIVIVAHQFIWGAIIMPWTKKYRMACLLTTIMQVLRRIKVSDPRNYEHSFVRELFARAGIKIPTIVVTIFTLTIFVAVIIQFCLFR